MEYVVQALKVLRNLVHGKTNAKCPKTGALVSLGNIFQL